MKKWIWFFVIGLICRNFFIEGIVQGANERNNETEISYQRLTNVEVDTISAQESKVIISLTGPVKYHCFKITKPLRLVVEMTDTLHNWSKKEIEVGDTLIKRVRSAQFQNEPIKISRVVLDLKRKVSCKDKMDEVTNKIILTVTSEGERAENEIIKNESEKIKAQQKVVKAKKKKSKIVRKEIKREEKRDEKIFPSISKEIVSLDFNEADIRDVLRILAIKGGVNIVYGDDVKGTITIHLKNVPFDDGMNMILKIRGLVIHRISENILRVITPESLAEERSKAVTFTKIFTLNYSTAKEMKGELESVKPQGAQTVIGVDDRTNKLIVTATPEILEDITLLIKKLDVKPAQVLIEARIMKVRRTDVGGLGVDWSFTQSFTSTSSGETSVVGEAAEPGKSIIQGGGVVSLAGQPAGSSTGKGTGFSAPYLGGGVVSFGMIADEMALNVALSALVEKGKSKVLACPKVATLNNQRARILIGQRVPYTTTRVDTSGVATQSTEFIDVGTRLLVTPTINIDKRITLNIKPEKSTLDEWKAAGPVIGTQEVETTVLVKDGETIVIAGLIDDKDIASDTKVPLLGDIPLVGFLFKKKTWDKERDELLIFLTPHIMDE